MIRQLKLITVYSNDNRGFNKSFLRADHWDTLVGADSDGRSCGKVRFVLTETPSNGLRFGQLRLSLEHNGCVQGCVFA